MRHMKTTRKIRMMTRTISATIPRVEVRLSITSWPTILYLPPSILFSSMSPHSLLTRTKLSNLCDWLTSAAVSASHWPPFIRWREVWSWLADRNNKTSRPLGLTITIRNLMYSLSLSVWSLSVCALGHFVPTNGISQNMKWLLMRFIPSFSLACCRKEHGAGPAFLLCRVRRGKLFSFSTQLSLGQKSQHKQRQQPGDAERNWNRRNSRYVS